MKRKVQKPVRKESNLVKAMQARVDEYLEAMAANEDEIASIVEELAKRDLSQAQIEKANDSFEAYNKAAKNLTEYMRRL